MRQNMAATAVEEPAAAATDLGFAAAGGQIRGTPRANLGGGDRIRWPGRAGRIGRQASGSNWDREVGGGTRTHERM
jgi:hypothetical protein